MPPEIIFACSDLRHLTGGLRFAGIAERFCKVCRHIGPQGKAGAPTQAAGTMQPVKSQYRAAATLDSSCRHPAGPEPPLVVSRAAALRATRRLASLMPPPQHSTRRCPTGPAPLSGEPQAPDSGLRTLRSGLRALDLGLRAPDFALRAPGFGPWTPGLGLRAPRSRQTCVAEWTLARNLCCRTDAKPLLQTSCRPFCKRSVFKASEMQQKFSPRRAGLPGWARPAEMRFATVGGPARPSKQLRRGSPQRQPAKRGRSQK